MHIDSYKIIPGELDLEDTAEYFSHGKHVDKFNSKEKEAFIKFMNDTNIKDYKNKWEAAVNAWDSFTELGFKVKKYIKITNMPDYSKLETE